MRMRTVRAHMHARNRAHAHAILTCTRVRLLHNRLHNSCAEQHASEAIRLVNASVKQSVSRAIHLANAPAGQFVWAYI